MKAPFLIGRRLFGGFFFTTESIICGRPNPWRPYAESKGVPTPESAVTLSALPLILGGASLLLGVKPKLGALAIIGFLAVVSPVMHDF
jgi:uncharacterized membrane protein YphA (DoxX/SURF4 family)